MITCMKLMGRRINSPQKIVSTCANAAVKTNTDLWARRQRIHKLLTATLYLTTQYR